jgi:hypothetical protein
VSLILDALRRGARPANAPAKPARTAHTDIVLATLGHRTRTSRLTPGTVALVAGVLFVAALAAWLMWA